MRNGLALLILLTTGAAIAQPPAGRLNLRVPERAELARLNLAMDWNISLPIDGPRDGIATVQLIPVPDLIRKGSETALLVVQMRSGTIAVYHADTGRKIWSKRPAPAYPVSVPEVAYDPRGALIVVRELYLYRYELYPTQAAATATTDETDNRIITFPALPSVTPTVVVADPTHQDEGLYIVTFNGNRLAVYGKAPPDYHVKPDNSVLDWKIERGEDDTRLMPGDNKAPSLTPVRSVFGPDYGFANPPREPRPEFPSLTLLHNLSRPDEFSTEIGSSPSLTVVPRLSQLTEMSRRDVRDAVIEGASRRGDILDFRLTQPAVAIRAAISDRIERSATGMVTRVIFVGGDRSIAFDTVTERIGLVRERTLPTEMIRSSISAPVAFRDSMMFVPTADGVVIAIDAEFGLINWTTSLQHLPVRRPSVVGPHVFITTSLGKLFRLNALDGMIPSEGGFAPDGSFPRASVRDFLAASDRHVYALDQTGNLVVLDRRRGSFLGSTDVRGFSFAFANDVTDRVILGSDQGRLICLRDTASPAQKLYRSNAFARAPMGQPPMNGMDQSND